MVKRTIIWSDQAQSDRIEILHYWIHRNKSKEYSVKLNALITRAIELLAKMPEIGKSHHLTETRIKIIKAYYIIYKFDDSELKIISIWDSRRDPQKMKSKLK